ncbi:MAG TPA: c-type cytochrome [Flavobacterium sp.]|jgi:cytochrome c|nr:c-type cytochrome [Flavobacterium sp.]
MKTTFFAITTAIILIGCGKKEEPKEPLYPAAEVSSTDQQIEEGRALFDNKGNCAACHQPDQRIIGPSIAEIAKIYKDSNGDIVAFLKENAEPIVDPEQYEVMKTNFAITKKMSDQELKALEAYIYSFANAQ